MKYMHALYCPYYQHCATLRKPFVWPVPSVGVLRLPYSTVSLLLERSSLLYNYYYYYYS